MRVYPTYAMVDEAGEVTDRWAGYPGVDGFIAQVEAALADRSTIEQKRRRFEGEPTLPLALSLAQYSEAVFANAEAVDYYRAVMGFDPARSSEMRGKIFTSMFYGLRTEDFTADQLTAEGWALLEEHQDDLEKVMQVEGVMKRALKPIQYVPFLEHALDRSAAALLETGVAGEDSEAIGEYRRRLAVDEALLIRRDRQHALRLRRDLLPPDWLQDLSEIHRFVWWCHENDLNLVEAHRLALEAAELAADDANRASILSTAAMLAYKLGDFDRAVAHQVRVVELSPVRQRYRDALARYEEARDAAVGEVIEPRTKAVYPDRVTLGAEDRGAVLAITGAGVRQRTIFKRDVYTIASYVSAGLDLALLADAPGGPAEAIRVLDVPKRLVMDLRRGVGRQSLVDALAGAIARNDPDNSMLDDDLEVFLALFERDAEKGDRIVFDYVPELGLTTTVNGAASGTIAGAALMEALWSVWFGEQPTDAALKRSLLPPI